MSSIEKGKQPVRDNTSPGLLSSNLGHSSLTTIDITEGIRELLLDDVTPRAGTPVGATFTSRESPRSRQASHGSGGAMPTTRPKLRRKAAIAPPGALRLSSTAPEPPRRAISARVARPVWNRDSYKGSSPSSPQLPRLSLFGTSTSRSLISRRKINRKPNGRRLGLKPRNNIWRLVPATNVKKFEDIQATLEGRQGSFSKNNRIKDIFKNKKVNVDFVKNIVNFEERELPETPNSVVSTPRELYGTPKSNLGSKQHLVPQPMPANTSKRSTSPSTSGMREREAYIQRRSAVKVISPESRPWKHRAYVPGPIRLANASAAGSRRAPIATLELSIDGEVQGSRNTTRRHSDDAVLDGIVAYFQNLVMVDNSHEDGLDKYWEIRPRAASSRSVTTSPQGRVGKPGSRRPSVPTLPSSKSPLLLGPRTAQKDETRLLPSQPRQRLGLRRLLQSASSVV